MHFDVTAGCAASAMAGEHGEVFVAKEWLTHDPGAACDNIREILEDANLLQSVCAIRFKNQMAIATVYTSNRMEGTLPLGASKHETYTMLSQILIAPTFPKFPCDKHNGDRLAMWHVDGGAGNKPDRNQMEAHVLALKFLTSAETLAQPLSVAVVKRAHYILTYGAYRDDKTPFVGGIVRDVACHAGNHAYPDFPAAVLEAQLERILCAFETTVSQHVKGATTLFTASAALFYDVITLHPFEDANGRLCRLLLVYALMKLGVPFPVPLTSGHTKARAHYMKAISMARQRKGGIRELNTLVLCSVERVLQDYKTNMTI